MYILPYETLIVLLTREGMQEDLHLAGWLASQKRSAWSPVYIARCSDVHTASQDNFWRKGKNNNFEFEKTDASKLFYHSIITEVKHIIIRSRRRGTNYNGDDVFIKTKI